VNILLIVADELDAQALGCAGHAFARTPHLDRLTSEGTRFVNALTPSPLCVPARAALATGRWVHETGCWDNALAYAGEPRGWAHQLRDEAGWRVESIGKLHYRDALCDTGFAAQHEPLHIANGIGQVWGSVRDPLPEARRPSHLFDQLGTGYSDYNRYDERVAARAQAWLEARAAQSESQPWLLFVGFVAPHFPLVVPKIWLDGIDIDALPLARQHPSRGYRRHPWVQRHADLSDADAELGSDARQRLALACYFGLVGFLDHQVGRVLQTLERTGLARDTLVVFTSDHGDNQGARGMWNKSTLYRESVNVPLLMRGPGVPQAHVCRTATSLVDIAPTVLDAAGVPGPASLTGVSLRAIAAQPDDLDRVGFSEYHGVGSPSAGYAIWHGRWAYHHYVGYPPELFDREADPDQLHDLAGDPAHAATCARLHALLLDRLDPAAIDRRAKADQAALIARFGGAQRALTVGTPGASPAPAADITAATRPPRPAG
jgi:choline-sulfatase